ncbi:hypothetical protein PN437_11835, partial [Microcystis aeruginosa CS-564/01]|nr:hypothetical protein [Microcystis aeruginosa CS-564/01]
VWGVGCGEVGKWGVGKWGSGENKAAFCLLSFAYCLLPSVSPLPSPCLPSSQWSRIFDKLSFGELAQPIR